MYGTADSRLVITVAPQKDICPQGKTYPKKAVPIKIRIIETPDSQTWVNLNELKISPRLMCVNSKIKKKDAPFIWRFRINHPLSTSRIM